MQVAIETAGESAKEREPDVRERIFSSALRHFSEKGFAATSLREVALDAGTTKPMIYYYFSSKEGLYSSIVREILEEMDEAIRTRLPIGVSASAKVMAFCERYMDHFLAQEEIIALVLREVFGLGGKPMATFAQTLGQQVRHPLDEILDSGMQSGEFQDSDIAQCATAITGILNMFILAHVFGGSPIHRDSPLQQVAFYVKGLARAA